jgi:hypothetical protein
MPLASVIIPYVKGISELFKCNRNGYNITKVFKMKHTFMGSLITRSKGDPQQMTCDSENIGKILKVFCPAPHPTNLIGPSMPMSKAIRLARKKLRSFKLKPITCIGQQGLSD